MIISKEDFDKTMDLIEENWLSNRNYAQGILSALEYSFQNNFWIKFWIDDLKCGTKYEKIDFIIGKKIFDLKYRDNLYELLIWDKGKGEF